jgi:hypothetical protein
MKVWPGINMIINSTDFFFSGTLWYKNPETG